MTSKWLHLVSLATVVATVSVFQPKAWADFIAVNNTGVAELGRENIANSTQLAASSFTTSVTSYNLVSVAALFSSETPSSETFEASIYSNVSGLPGTLLHTLSGQDTLPPNIEGTLVFTSGGFVFDANTTYWVAFRSVNGTGDDQGPVVASNISQFTPVGWTINAGRSFSTNGGTAWSPVGDTPLKFAVTVNTEVPEPASLISLALGGAMMLGRRRV